MMVNIFDFDVSKFVIMCNVLNSKLNLLKILKNVNRDNNLYLMDYVQKEKDRKVIVIKVCYL